MAVEQASGPGPARRKQKRRVRPGFALFRFDRSRGRRFSAGADEAGRGCLAGPLVAAAVLFDLERFGDRPPDGLEELTDSKLLEEDVREALYPRILEVATRVCVVSRSARCIDEQGLHVTNMRGLGQALAGVGPTSEAACFVDGFKLRGCWIEHERVVKGDRTSAAIAAASVVAKVTRDRYMRSVADLYPHWGFDGHVGYSTPEHRDAIRANGMSPLHRRSFNSTAYEHYVPPGELELDRAEAA